MGNFEKIVVLFVLLASAGALAVSLNNSDASDGTPAGPGEGLEGELGSALQPTGPARTPASSKPSVPATTKQRSSKVLPKLDAGFQPSQKSSTTGKPNAQGMPYILITKKGLKPAAFSSDYMSYRPTGSDTWMSLAQRFYGSRSHVSNIKMANEGIQEPSDVDELMIPIYDFITGRTERAAYVPAPRLEKSPYAPTTESATATLAPVAGSSAGGITYEVVSGDSLSLISQKVYGKASRWREIFAANRNKLKDEDSLKLGMRLYIPKAGEYKPATSRDSSKVQ